MNRLLAVACLLTLAACTAEDETPPVYEAEAVSCELANDSTDSNEAALCPNSEDKAEIRNELLEAQREDARAD